MNLTGFRYGYSFDDGSGDLLCLKPTGELVYSSGNFVVLYSRRYHSQRHYLEHTSQVTRYTPDISYNTHSFIKVFKTSIRQITDDMPVLALIKIRPVFDQQLLKSIFYTLPRVFACAQSYNYGRTIWILCVFVLTGLSPTRTIYLWKMV